MNLFFAFESDIPSGQGFALFSAGHILFLALTAFCTLVSCFVYARADRARQARAEKVFGAVLLALELLYNGMLFFSGHLDAYTLPLHLCAISVFVCVAAAFSGSARLGQYMYYFGMPGALCALVFPDWTGYPIGNYYCISAFVIHGMLVASTFALLCARRVRPDGKGLALSLAFVAALAVPMWMLNRRFGTNYMFLMTPSPGSPLEWLSNLTGERLYLPGFILLVLLIELLLYLPWARKKTVR